MDVFQLPRKLREQEEELKQLTEECEKIQKKLIEMFEVRKRLQTIINHNTICIINTNVDVSEKVEPQDLIRTCLASEDLAVRWELNVDIFLLRRNLQRASCVIDICLP